MFIGRTDAEAPIFWPPYVKSQLTGKDPTSVGSLKKQESSRITSTSALSATPKPLTVWVTTNYGKFFKTWDY